MIPKLVWLIEMLGSMTAVVYGTVMSGIQFSNHTSGTVPLFIAVGGIIGMILGIQYGGMYAVLNNLVLRPTYLIAWVTVVSACVFGLYYAVIAMTPSYGLIPAGSNTDPIRVAVISGIVVGSLFAFAFGLRGIFNVVKFFK
jgi:hypothetical protein